MEGSSALHNFEKYLAVLQLALQQQQALPRRHFQTLEEFKKYLPSEPELDVTEIRTERPSDKQIQQDPLLLTDKEKRILYVSELYEGSVHDYHLLVGLFFA
jgi:hypothetical protein